ncbi:hypothetical protein [Candidatus Sororendozoicomonas aggregata]|uniref:hypothetical protein n=1 Tax=Candidatus Sororendozoicomonas aggregata TaxID=3073239 RepID=UPI002ED1C001
MTKIAACLTYYNESLNAVLSSIITTQYAANFAGVELDIYLILDGREAAHKDVLERAGGDFFDTATLETLTTVRYMFADNSLRYLNDSFFVASKPLDWDSRKACQSCQSYDNNNMSVIPLIKDENKGKQDSIKLFYKAIKATKRYDYTIHMDTGSLPARDTIYRMVNRISEENIAGVASNMTAVPDFSGFTLTEWQRFDYQAQTLINLAAGDVAGRINVLPGCFSLYDYNVISKIINNKHDEGFGQILAHLAEDRLYCHEIVVYDHNKRFVYESKADVYIDPCHTSKEFLWQRRRWVGAEFISMLCSVGDAFKGEAPKRYVLSAIPQLVFSWFCPGVLSSVFIYLLTHGGTIANIFSGLGLVGLTGLIASSAYGPNIFTRISISAVALSSAFLLITGIVFHTPLASIAMVAMMIKRPNFLFYLLLCLPVRVSTITYALINIGDMSWGTKGKVTDNSNLKFPAKVIVLMFMVSNVFLILAPYTITLIILGISIIGAAIIGLFSLCYHAKRIHIR